MTSTTRSTVYFDEELHKALRLKAAETDRTISELVNDAVRQSLSGDEEDLAVFRERADEPSIGFEAFVRDLKSRGEL